VVGLSVSGLAFPLYKGALHLERDHLWEKVLARSGLFPCHRFIFSYLDSNAQSSKNNKCAMTSHKTISDEINKKSVSA